MTMRKPNKKIVAVMALTVALLGAGGAAFAYWTAGGAGTGSATSGTGSIALTVNQTTVLAGMQPGDTAQTVSGTFGNTNTSPVYVTSVTASIGAVTKAGGAPAGTCDATDFTLASAVMPVGHEVAVGNPVDAWTGATIKFNNKAATNQDACKGATVALAYSIQ
jgi:hypothetical protein